jgi:hypothetical protein
LQIFQNKGALVFKKGLVQVTLERMVLVFVMDLAAAITQRDTKDNLGGPKARLNSSRG